MNSDSSSMDGAPSQFDLILSSGYLAFASHIGFLRGVERWGIEPVAVVGTSSGALVGALYASGKSLTQIAQLLRSARPVSFLRLRPTFWRGVFSAQGLRSLLDAHLPETFEQLPMPFAVGVADARSMQHTLLRSGRLPEAVLASCAVPGLLQPVTCNGRQYVDGGVADRLGLREWRNWRPGAPGIVHHVERSRGAQATSDIHGTVEVTSPRSNNSLLRLVNFQQEMDAACDRTIEVIDRWKSRRT